MRRFVQNAARLQYLGGSTGSRTTAKNKIGTLPLLFGVATGSEVLPCDTPSHASDFFKREPACLGHRTNVTARYSSWRDVPQLARETMYDVYNKTEGIVERRMQSEGGSATTYITAANLAVYVLWKLAPTGFMVRFGYEVADILGAERFYLFYGAAGVASSLASLTFRRITKSNVLSLGASGAVVATLWLYACFFPDRRMSILGSEKTLTMQELVLAYTVIDAAGLLGSSGKIDFAAHLGGAVFGNSWFHLVREKLVQEHSMRKSDENRSMWRGLSGIGGRHPSNQSNEK